MRFSSEKMIHHVYVDKGNHPFVDIHLASLGGQRPYFSITTGRGCDHDRIERLYPELKPFIDLHLSGIDGSPMYPEENGFYHYAEGVKENGKPCYFPTEEAKKTEEERLNAEALLAFQQAAQIDFALAHDIWVSMNTFKVWRKATYESALFAMAQEFYHNKPSVLAQSVVARNNKHLASHLRISLEEASAIPAGLTKAEFIKLHVEPHRERWQAEADAAITLLKEWEELYPPFDDEIEKATHYFYGADKYTERLPEIQKRRKEQRAFPIC